MEQNDMIFVCPKCGTVGASREGGASCFNCENQWMVRTGYDAEQWKELSAQQKNTIIEDAKKSLPEDDSSTRSSGWIKMLKAIAIIWMIASMLASTAYGIVLMIEYDKTGLGVLSIAVGCFLALIITAAVMVFLDMAADVRRIRGMLEKKN